HHEPADDATLLAERERITRKLGNVEKKVEAPETIRPDRSESLNPDSCLADIASTRSFLIEQSGKLTDDILRSNSFPHPFLGNLTLYGWLWFISQHELRHAHQMQNLTV
ncbi:MAG: DinB family protein, partial [Candidatus Kapabacteria bacterium]|nr:DinB family protein [Candidatus Kapabacteria bacterium]